MQPRLNPDEAAPEAMQAVRALASYVGRCGLEPRLIKLVEMRASQINGGAFCLDMHSRDARRLGETEQRLYLLDAWRESPLYSAQERAALAWTEALTRIAETRAPDADYAALREQFSEAEIVKISLLIATINALNRLAIGFRAVHPA
ncbi:MAG: carboxymuconolactone decarboxylase family protein [Acetobacteraceae bacterium]|nr:carboxymuconolactone decarboxylase family protein [Acetobacteraceae bacterium]